MHIEKSKSIYERATRVIPGGVNSATRRLSQPYSWKWAQGAYIRDADGNTYLDYHAALARSSSATMTRRSTLRSSRR